ncbi:MAG TPA: hypothetical protein VGS57_12765 [Thermoanaerobaculia bacterium]|nr:hypothetical protein [Thermoanaerobaculia bacterium]
MYHASYAYPSEVVPFVELGLTLLLFAIALWRPRSIDAWLTSAWQGLRAVPPRRAVIASAVAALLASLASMAALGAPVPHVSDEFGYLLLADNFAAGRLANLQPAVPAAFEAVYVLVRPSYASKYPPVQGAILALGQILGHPAVGVALSTALLAAACCWFLRGWLPPPWPLLGAALATLRLGVGSYWGQSYWGGTMTAIGGMLVYGALPRLATRDAPRDEPAPWLPIAAGLFLLANSRPMEGAVAALPAAVVLAWRTLPIWRSQWRPLLLPLTLGLVAGAAVTAAYDRAVTGNAWLLPYHLHDVTYGVQVPIPFMRPAAPVRYSSPALAAHLAKRFPPTPPADAVVRAAGHFARMAWFVCGLPLIIGAVVALRRPDPWRLFALLAAALPAAVHAVTPYWSPHYAAAATGPLLLLGLFGWRDISSDDRASAAKRLSAPWLAGGALLVQLGVTLVELPAHRPDADDWSRSRQRLEQRLEREPPSVVVVGDRVRAVEEWVCNRADLRRAHVLWIQDLGPDVTRRVAAAYAPRTLWRLDADAPGDTPRLSRLAAPR